jgi:hypothetical protein
MEPKIYEFCDMRNEFWYAVWISVLKLIKPRPLFLKTYTSFLYSGKTTQYTVNFKCPICWNSRQQRFSYWLHILNSSVDENTATNFCNGRKSEYKVKAKLERMLKEAFMTWSSTILVSVWMDWRLQKPCQDGILHCRDSKQTTSKHKSRELGLHHFSRYYCLSNDRTYWCTSNWRYAMPYTVTDTCKSLFLYSDSVLKILLWV